MQIKYRVVVGGIMAALAFNAIGQEAEKTDEGKKQELSSVVVTATKTERSTENVANSVTVIDEKEIKAKGSHSLLDVLSGTPGIAISRNGGPGTQSSLFMRGAESKNVLLLIDGVPYNDPSGANRNAALANVSTSNVQRIEIIRGPQSVLYGSNAAAGVINVITKEGDGKPTLTYRTEAGSYDTFRNTLSTSGTLDRLSYSLSADSYESQGFSIANRDNKDIPNDGNKNEKDGYRSETYSLSLKYRITDDFDVTITGRQTESEVETDAYGPGYAGDSFDLTYPPPSFSPTYVANLDSLFKQEVHTDEAAGRIDVHNRFADGMLESNFYASHSEFKTQAFDNEGDRDYDSVGKTEQYGWQGNLNTVNNILTLGFDLYREFYYSDGNDIDENADTKSAWIQNQTEIGGFYLVAGARHDNHDRFGEHTTWRIAPAYMFESGTKIKASYGTGFRAPSLFELYSTYGNELLEPEESIGWDAGIEQRVGDSIVLGVTYFETEYHDLIDWDSTLVSVSPWGGYNQVSGDTDTQGAEIYSTWKPSETVGFTVNYTYTDTEDNDGHRLVRRPLHKAMFATDVKFLAKAGLRLEGHYVGERDASEFAFDQFGNAVGELDAYVLVNLSLYYDVCTGFKVFGRIDNVTDEHYEHAWSYATPGRSYYMGCEITF